MVKLSVAERRIFGKQVRKLRQTGQVPAVVYGHGILPVALAVPEEGLRRAYHEAGESSLVALTVDGAKARNVLIHDLSRDALTGKFLHVDFYEVKMDEKIKTRVQLNFVGEAPAVKTLEGTLVKNIHELEIEALPKDLPHDLTVDLGKLETFEDHITVADIPLPAGATVEAAPDEIVAVVVAPRAEAEEPAPAVEGLAEQVEQVKVEGEEKRREREAKREGEEKEG